MVLRNLPSVEPSSDFYDRLTTTLHRMERADAQRVALSRPRSGVVRRRGCRCGRHRLRGGRAVQLDSAGAQSRPGARGRQHARHCSVPGHQLELRGERQRRTADLARRDARRSGAGTLRQRRAARTLARIQTAIRALERRGAPAVIVPMRSLMCAPTNPMFSRTTGGTLLASSLPIAFS